MRVAVLCDYAEERWPSMDLVAAMLLEQLQSSEFSGVHAARIQPRMKRCSSAGRLAGRFLDYPRYARRIAADYDVFHLVDHSYSQLVHALPPGRTVVTCHDTDTFRCLFDPRREPRPFWFRAMARRILSGLEKAAFVACASNATRQQLLHHGVVPASRSEVVPNGVHADFLRGADAVNDLQMERLLGPPAGVEILHVGSTIPRKRIDVLLNVFAECRARRPDLRLLRVGGAFTEDQRALVRWLGLGSSIQEIPALSRESLAALYRRAALVLTPSEAEGFGMPVAEALACGTPVIASDLAALRETGGSAAEYCPVGDVAAWADCVLRLLEERSADPPVWALRRKRARDHARQYSWSRYARQMVALWSGVLGVEQKTTEWELV